MSRLFREFHQTHSDKNVIFPSEYYQMISRTIEELANIKSDRFTYLTHSTAGSTWMLGTSNDTGVSTNTYDWIWKNLRLILNYDRDEFISYYWGNASRYFGRSLNYISSNFSHSAKKIVNQKEIDQREAERKSFLNFHYALGGLLLYKRKYGIINMMFRFTQSDPPEYLLLPKNTDQVFNIYFDFEDPFNGKYQFINSDFRFSDSGGFEMESEVRHWICSFIALLFLRQFSLKSNTYKLNPLTPPNARPINIPKQEWVDGLTNFRFLVVELIKNRELLKVTGLDFITDKWCEDNKKPTPLKIIEAMQEYK